METGVETEVCKGICNSIEGDLSKYRAFLDGTSVDNTSRAQESLLPVRCARHH